MNAGDRYGRYQIVRILGRGAMGEVYLALDNDAGREVAVKVVYSGSDSEDEEVLTAERLGAELQKRLGGVDPRVVLVNRYGNLNGDLFIEMEYIEGQDLSSILSRGPLPPQRAAQIGIELCGMLENLRRFTTTIDDKQFVGVVHGDLKPRNIRITSRNQVKVMDFGIAKALSETRKHTLNLFASTAYCSPERLDTQNMDSHSDLWSVGVLLYQMIAGKLPFDEPNKERLERRIKSSQPPDALPADCPEPLRNIVFTMLAYDPARRYQNAVDVKEDLLRFLSGELVHAKTIESDATVRTATGIPRNFPDDATLKSTTFIPVGQPKTSKLRIGCLALLALTVIPIAMQFSVWSDAEELKKDLETEHVTDHDQAWSRYQSLTTRKHLPLTLRGVRRALKQKLVAAADETIREYRINDAPTVREAQWKQALADLSRALELNPSDKATKGKMRLCEGHLVRINAKGTGRLKMLNTAAGKFQEAAELLKGSPDPYLGLARLYVYDLNDMDRAEEALTKAAKHGHPMGNREKAQLADGYRRRGDRTWKASRAFASMPQHEKEYLEKVRDDYLHAGNLYQQIGSFYGAAQNRIQTIQAMAQVEQRLRDVEEGVTSQ